MKHYEAVRKGPDVGADVGPDDRAAIGPNDGATGGPDDGAAVVPVDEHEEGASVESDKGATVESKDRPKDRFVVELKDEAAAGSNDKNAVGPAGDGQLLQVELL